MRYPNPNDQHGFIPEATGQIIDPLAMPPEEADALLGAEFMQAVRETAEKLKGRPMQYVQLVPTVEGPKRAD